MCNNKILYKFTIRELISNFIKDIMKNIIFLILFTIIGLKFNLTYTASDALINTNQYAVGDTINIRAKFRKIISIDGDILTVAWDNKKNRSFKIRKSDDTNTINNDIDYLIWVPAIKGYAIDSEKYQSTANIHPGDKITIASKAYKVISVDGNTIMIDESIFPWQSKRYRSYTISKKGEPIKRGGHYLAAIDDKTFIRLISRYGVD